MNTAAVKLLYLVVLMGCCGQGTAQFQSCYDATGCGGNIVSDVSNASDCCLGSGFSFMDGGTCQQCIVHGFRDDSIDLSVSETSPQQIITIALNIKGSFLFTIFQYDFDVICLDSSSDVNVRVPDFNDFASQSCNSSITLFAFPTPGTYEMGIIFWPDHKIEGTEVLTVQLRLSSASQTAVNNAGNIFIRDTSTIRVTDTTVLRIGFSEDDYEGLEDNPNRPCVVTAIVHERTLDIPIQIRLTPRALSATANKDFNVTEIVIDFGVGDVWKTGSFQIIHDEINEAREEFEVSLTVLGNISLSYTIQNTTCRIPENDPIDIGFTIPRINHIEEFRYFDTIINKSRVSEQTFELRIQITTILSGVGQRATRGEDFEIGGVIGSIVVLQMRPEENSISFTYLIQDDPTPENQEVFQLFVTPNPGSPAFSCDIYNGCYLRVEVVIIDDDVVVVGYVDTLVEVNETDGLATLNVSISSPQPDPVFSLGLMFSLNLASTQGTAGSNPAGQSPTPGINDFSEVISFTPHAGAFYFTYDEMSRPRFPPIQILTKPFNNTRRSESFTIPIYMDDVPEGVEEFSLTLTLVDNPTLPSTSVNVTPAVATVRIHDLSTVVVGFERHTYTVGEDDGQVELCVNITVPRRQDVGTVTFNLSVETQNCSAVSPDDYTSVSMMVGTFTSQRPRQCFSISITNDAITERTEDFTARLTLIPDTVTTINASRIIVDPPETTVQITDNDFEIRVGYVQTNVTLFENGGVATLTVAISVPPGAYPMETSFYLLVNTMDGSAAAAAPSDYGALNNFRLGPFSKDVRQLSFNVSIVNDDIPEDAELFRVSLTLDPDDRNRLESHVIVSPDEANVTINEDNDEIRVGYVQANVTVFESDGVARLTVAISVPPGADPMETSFYLLVNTMDGSATAAAPSDYGALANFHLGPFNNSVRQLSFNVSIVNDDIPEDTETFGVSLTLDPDNRNRLSNRVTVSPDVATITMQDNDRVMIGIGPQRNHTATEGINSTVECCVVIAVPDIIQHSDISVCVSTVDGTATAGQDYQLITNMYLGPFGSNNNHQCFNVSILDDTWSENSEYFMVNIQFCPGEQPERVDINPSTGTTTIIDDDDVVVGFEELSYSVDEGVGQLQVCVVVTMPPQSDVLNRTFSLSVSTSVGTAGKSDFIPVINQAVGLFSNTQRQQCFSVEITDDAIAEDTENFSLNLTLRPGEVLRQVINNPAVAEITINDNDRVTLGIELPISRTVTESVNLTVEYCVVITQPDITAPIERGGFSVCASSVDGTATAGQDYQPVINIHLGPFDNNDRRQCFNVNILNDTHVENPENFTVNVQSCLDETPPERVDINPSTATTTIIDDDDVVVGFEELSYSVDEGVGQFQVCVAVTKPPQSDVLNLTFSLNVSTSLGSAGENDFTAIVNQNAGQFSNVQRQQCFFVKITNDTIPESLETFYLNLTNGEEVLEQVTIWPAVAEVTIRDTDPPDGPPLNLAVQSVNSTSLTLSWEPPSLPHQTGATLNYTLTCIPPAESSLPPVISVFTTSGAHTLNDLTPATVYSCSVFATNVYGNGPPANISAMTEDGVPGSVTGVTFQKVSDSEIFVTWREPEMTNGLILHYIITVTFYSTGRTVYTNMVSGGLSDMVTGLAPYIPYQVAISPQNSNPAPGEVNSDIAFTREGTPTVAPRDVETTRLNGTHMNISWELPSLLEARGFIDSIIITFKPNFGSNQKERQVVTVEAPGNSTSTVIGGLTPDLQYSVTVSTSTSEGAGPEASAVVQTPCIKIFQLLLGKVNDCNDWRFQNTREKLAGITSSIITAVNSRCRCSLTANHISSAHFVCTSDQQVVLYRAELSGRPDCAQVLSYIQQRVSEGQAYILVEGNIIEVYPNCPIEVSSLTAQANCTRPTTVGTDSTSPVTTGVINNEETVAGETPGSSGNIVAVVAGVGGVLFTGIITLAAVVAFMCIHRHRNKQRTVKLKSNEAYGAVSRQAIPPKPYQATHQVTSNQPPIKPPLPSRSSILSPPVLNQGDSDASHVKTSSVSINQEEGDGYYEKIEENIYEQMDEGDDPRGGDVNPNV